MSDAETETEDISLNDEVHVDLQRRDDIRFQHDVEVLLRSAEDMRMRFMMTHRTRNFISFGLSVLSILIGAAGFGWFFIMKADLLLGLSCIAASVILPIFCQFWVGGPVKAYAVAYKKEFMPKMAHVLGGLKFYPRRGISSKIIAKSGVMPPFTAYEAEDCFMGRYKGVKVLFSEGRLYQDQKKQVPVFDGVLVLLELDEKLLEGHTIITADNALAKRAAPTIWKNFTRVPSPTQNPDWNVFQIYSTKPDAAALTIGEKLLKELAEAAKIFNNALLSTVLFGGKYVFVAIPYEQDMFEASNMHIPVATKQHAMKCKREIDQLLEIVDIFDLYKGHEAQ